MHLAKLSARGLRPLPGARPSLAYFELAHAHAIAPNLFPEKLPLNGSRLLHVADARPYTSAASLAIGEKEDASQDDTNDRFLRKVARLSPAGAPSYSSLNRWTFEKRRFQANILADDPRNLRYVNNAYINQDLTLWSFLLAHRAEFDGKNGIKEIWRGMRARKVDLPTHEPQAAYLWNTIVSAALNEPGWLQEVYEHALDVYNRTGQSYGPLYKLIMSHMLLTQPENSLDWHHRFQTIALPAVGYIRSLVPDAIKSKASLVVFRHIYLASPSKDVYDYLIPHLCRRKRLEEATEWHHFLLQAGDRPTTSRAALKLAKSLRGKQTAWTTSDVTNVAQFMSEKLGSKEASNSSSPASIRASANSGAGRRTALREKRRLSREKLDASRSAPPVTRQVMSEFLGEAHGIKPKQMSDRFCARLLATRAFPVDSILTFVRMIGGDIIGPLALRELALRCDSAADVARKLSELPDKGLSIGSSTYSQLVKNAADGDKKALLDSILESDQHPDVYDDRELQLSLLDQYLVTDDWVQAWRILSSLTTYHRAPVTESWNLLLVSFVKRRDWENIMLILDEMLSGGIRIKRKTLRHSFFALRPLRKPGKRPPVSIDATGGLGFLVKMWLKIIQSGGYIPLQMWNSIHTDLGMLEFLDEMETVSHCLVSYYPESPSPRSLSGDSGSNNSDLSDPTATYTLNDFFDPKRQAAMIAWGFKTLHRARSRNPKNAWKGLSPAWNSFPCDEWARGVACVKGLQRHGITVDPATVADACGTRLMVLFGPLQSFRRDNRMARAKNPHSLRHMVIHLNQLWGSNLFGVPDEVLQEYSTDSDAELWRLVIGSRMMEA